MIGHSLEFLSQFIAVIYGALLLTCYFFFRRMKKKNNSGAFERSVAVVIAARNEEAHIPELLKALETQEVSFSFHVIIVDDHSEDRTMEIARKHWPRKFTFDVHQNRGNGKKDALTTGIYSTMADVILVTDADCIPDSKWVTTMAEEFTDPTCTFAAGMIRPSGSDNALGATLATETVFLQVVSAGLYGMGKPVMCNGASMAFTRKFFMDSGGFSNDNFVSGDDAAMLSKAAMQTPHGIRWVKNEEAMVSAPVASSFKEAIVQRHRWLSKAQAYANPVQSLVGMLFLLAQLLLPLMVLAQLLGFWDNPFVGGLAIKLVVELLLLSLAASFFRAGNTIIMLPVSAVLYCVISLAAVIRLFGKDVEWKGRNWKSGKAR